MAQPNAANSPDMKEIRAYRLSLDAVRHFVAAQSALTKSAEVNKCFQSSPAPGSLTLDASQKRLESCPAVVTILKANNLKAREFLIITTALVGDLMAVDMKRAGQIKAYPETISPENAAFVEQNYDKLKAALAPIMGGR